MEKFKNNIILENSVMQDKIDEWRNLLFLIVNMDYSISERTQTLTRIIYNWPKKLDQILDESNSVHFEQKEAIENKMQATKVKFEKEMEEFEEEIKEIETYVDLFSYPMYMIPINKFNQKFQGMKKRKERLELEETILIDETSPYESFVRVKKTFEPHYNFWKTTENFLDSKKKWKAVTASELNIEQIHNVKTDTKTMMKAVKGKLHEDQIKLIEGMLRQIKDLESWISIIETLSNPGLKDRHWEEIQEISGPDLDFKKLSIDRIKFLKIEYMIDPIMKVSEKASQEYSIELYMKNMRQELSKISWSITLPKTNSIQSIQDDNKGSILSKEKDTKDNLIELRRFKVSLRFHWFRKIWKSS